MWNDSRSAEGADFFTMGYEGRKTDDLLATMIGAPFVATMLVILVALIAYLLVVSLIFVTINLIVDVLYTVVDPRLRSTIQRPA